MSPRACGDRCRSGAAALNVALVIDKFPPFIGGAESQAELLARRLRGTVTQVFAGPVMFREASLFSSFLPVLGLLTAAVRDDAHAVGAWPASDPCELRSSRATGTRKGRL